MDHDVDLSQHRRWGCIGLAALGLLAAVAACSLGYARVRAFVVTPPPHPHVQTLSLGPIRLMSGMTALDACLDNWRCPSKLFSRRSGQPTSYRLWLFTTHARKGVQGYKLVEITVAWAAPQCPARTRAGC